MPDSEYICTFAIIHYHYISVGPIAVLATEGKMLQHYNVSLIHFKMGLWIPWFDVGSCGFMWVNVNSCGSDTKATASDTVSLLCTQPVSIMKSSL